MLPTPILVTDRLMLRGHAPGDLDACAALWDEPDVYRFIGGAARTREETWIRLLRSIGHWAVFGYGPWVVCEKPSGRLVGEIGPMEARRTIEPSIEGAPEMGWTLVPAVHGRGYAREALEAIFAWLDAAGMRRTVCIIDPENAASIALAERVGYRLAATGRYHGATTNIYERVAAAPPIG